MVNIYIIIINIFLLAYITNSIKFLAYYNDIVINNIYFLSILLLIVVGQLILGKVIKYMDIQSKIIEKKNYFIFFLAFFLYCINLFVFLCNFYLLAGLGSIFIKILMIENQYFYLDGILEIGLNFKLERVFSPEEKLQFAMHFLNSRLSPDILSQYSLTLDQLNKIVELKTLSEIEAFLSTQIELLMNNLSNKSGASGVAYSWYYLLGSVVTGTCVGGGVGVVTFLILFCVIRL